MLNVDLSLLAGLWAALPGSCVVCLLRTRQAFARLVCCAVSGAMSELASRVLPGPPDGLLSLPVRRSRALEARLPILIVALQLWRCLVLLCAPEQHQ